MPGRGASPVASLAILLACATATPVDLGPDRYRLTGSGKHWTVSGDDHVLDDVRPHYEEFFSVVYDKSRGDAPNLKRLREDLERSPVSRANYDALNALAIAYFELNARAERNRGGGLYFADSTRAAQIVAVPWRAYSEVEDGALRSAILDFFEDIAIGGKLMTDRTSTRLADTVASLERKEPDPERADRIRAIVVQLAPR